MRYRPEIDGLRAVAVAAVVAYHAGAPVPGGFAGVDVFFVLSGYLIGGLLFAELAATGRIDLSAFWLRRLRRLAPAFLLMALVTLGAGFLVLLPFELREMGKQAVAAALWASNLLFWRQAGYFDTGAREKPFLHTWSLAVEEQFYVVLPLLLFLLLLLARRRMVPVLAVLWAASLAATVALTAGQPDATFFLLPFRGWELLSGVLLAAWTPRVGAAASRGLGWGGLAVIVASLFLVRPEGFPGWQALLPVAGTAMAIAALGGPTPGAGAWLSHPAPVFLGRISYALYLWHWPVLVIAGLARGEMGAAERLLWVAVAVALSVVSWRLVETPLRRAPEAGGVRTPVFLAGTGLAAAVVLGVGGLAFLRDGFPGRFPPEVRAHIDASQGFLQDWSRCGVQAGGPFAGLDACLVGPEGPPEVLLWGDSHLRALMDGAAAAADDAGVPGVLVWRAGCAPAFGVTKAESAATPAEDALCPATSEAIRAAVERAPSLRAVLLVGRWAYYAEGRGVGLDAANRIEVRLGDLRGEAALAYGLRETVAWLEGRGLRVAILRQVPEMPLYDSREVARGLAHGWITQAEALARAGVPAADLAARTAASEAAIAGAGAELLDPLPLFCDAERCDAMRDGRALWFDTNHLTNEGAAVVAPLLRGWMEGALGR